MAKDAKMDKPVSLTTFVDFVSKAGTPKATVMRKWKESGEYDVVTDFYKRVREAIVEYHKNGMPIDTAFPGCDKKKLPHFDSIVAGHKKWVRRKDLKWFAPSMEVWQCGQMSVSINPELGLIVGGVPHLIKLYFKGEKLAKSRVNIITQLMTTALASVARKHCVMAVLDVRKARLFAGQGNDPRLEDQLRAEAAYWNALWPTA